jgi:NAD(P)-dependent dehydrogenase (short-subunit alcohol dehydrogenase family)
VKEFTGKTAVITGGASGIGLGLARRFLAEGMHVVIGDVEKRALDAVVDELGVTGVLTDVTDPVQMQALADVAVDAHGGVDIFCNNAGVGGGGLSWEMPLSTWEWVINVDLWGVIHGVRTFVPLLLQRPEGHIVNTTPRTRRRWPDSGPHRSWARTTPRSTASSRSPSRSTKSCR